MNPTILGLGPGFLNQVPTLGFRAVPGVLRRKGARFRAFYEARIFMRLYMLLRFQLSLRHYI